MKWTKAELLLNHKNCKRTILKLGADCYDKMEIALVELLLKEHRQLLTEKIKLKQMLERIEWSNNVSKKYALCPICYGKKDKGHDKNCELANLLKTYKT